MNAEEDFERDYGEDTERNSDASTDSSVRRLIDHLIDIIEGSNDARRLFLDLVRELERPFDISKAMFALRQNQSAEFIAAAAWNNGRERRSLSLRLPHRNTLFGKVIENGEVYAENFAQFYDGGMIERQLLIDDDTASFMLRPLKYEGSVVALVGLSSHRSDAFLLVEEGVLDRAMDKLATKIGELQLAARSLE